MIFAFLFLLLLAYCAAFLGAEHRQDNRVLNAWPIASIAVAAIAAGLILATLFSAADARRATQIAWIGVSNRHAEDPLDIGGSRQKATIGWPNGSFSPALSLRANADNGADLTITGGGGFVRGAAGIMNGTPLPDEGRTQAGAFTIETGSPRFRPWHKSIRILDSAEREVGSFSPRIGGDPRVSSLYSNLTVDIARLRKTDGAAAAALESWSTNLRLLVARSGLRILPNDSPPVTASIKLPAQITIYWPGQSQPVELKPAGERRIQATFLPPWRLVSPLPEEPQLTLEARALPGDTAFLLPLGGDLRGFTETVALKGNRFERSDRQPGTEFQKVLSEDTIFAGKYALRFASVHDLPSWTHVLAIIVLGLGMFAFGLGLARARMRWRDGWVLGGIATAIWVILLTRLMLSFRYALDPAHFDKFAFDGVASAARALIVVPALILIAVRLRRDRAALFHFKSVLDKARAGKQVLLHLGLTILTAGIITAVAHSLWPNVEERYTHFSLNPSVLFTAFIITVALLWMLGYIFFLYFYDPDREVSERFRAKLEELRSRFLRRITETFALEQSEGFWRHLGSTLDDEDEAGPDYMTRLKVLAAVLGSLVGAAVIIGAITWVAGANEKFLQEVAAPFLLCWMPACLWLAARLRFRPGTRMSRRNKAWLVPWLLAAGLLILAPVFLFPILLGDAGGIVAAFSFFWPAVALLAAGGKPRRLQWMPMGVLLLAVAGAGVMYLNLSSITKLPGEAQVRLLIFKEGLNLQDRLLGLPMLKEDATGTPTVRQVSQGLQHTWENKAIAHEGGWFGLGYGRAPGRRSQVPQHTLQVDSTYSFFIESEFGLLGGACLLLIYAMPLVWVLISARPRFDTGHGLATLIASAFLIEAIFHAGMNLTAFPYTGRDLPLLAVSSFTDLARWTILFCLAVRALQWRAVGSDAAIESYRTESIISPPALPGAKDTREPVGSFRFAALIVLALPAVLFGTTLVRAVQIIEDPDLSRPFQWTRLLNAVRQAADQGKLTVDPKTMNIQVADESLAAQGGTLLDQEIARFNALTEAEKVEGLGTKAAEFRRRLRSVHTIVDYDRLLQWLRTSDDEDRQPERPLLFRLAADPRTIDEEGRVPVANRNYQILPNPAFNTSVSFHELRKEDIPAVSLRGQAQGMYVIRGRNFEFHVPNLATRAYDERTVTIEEGTGGAFRKLSDTSPDSPDVKLWVKYKPEKRGKPTFAFGELRVAKDGISFRPSVDSRLVHPGRAPKKLARNVLEKLVPGDHVEVAFAIGKNKVQPSFAVEKTAQGALVGPAWVMGNWVPTYDPDPLIPWTANLANALPDEQTRLGKDLPARFGTLTFDKSLQAALQTFSTEKGREHYVEYLRTGRAGREPLPPRMAISVITLPRGEVAGMGGWPRMSSSKHWDTGPGGDPIPPFTWLDSEAPHSIRIRYQGDRNFDRIAVGSESKPIWASAVLRLHRGLDTKLDTRGPDTEENDVFGIQIPGKGWEVHASDWHDLAAFLTESDNRYQVRLGFLGLAKSDPDRPSDITPGATSPSTKESLNGGQSPWEHYPIFDEGVDFMPQHPGRLRGLEQTQLAERLKAMYGIGIETGEIVHRRSFWTGDEQNDWDPVGKAPLSQALEYTSPEAPDFEFNRIDTPRRYITLLLGGGSNLWANVDFAGAFGTCVLGVPVTPHVTQLAANLIKPAKERAEGFDEPASMYKGLAGVIDASDGTANRYLKATHALAVLDSLPGVKHYAKTGTLGSDEKSAGNVSRIALALVRGDKKGAQTGLVISVVVEHAAIGTATNYLGEFIVQNEQDLRRLLGVR